VNKKTAAALCLIVAALSFAAAQIRGFVPIVRPVYHQGTLEFLERLGDELKGRGYKDASEVMKSYAKGGFGSGFVVMGPDGLAYVLTNRHVVAQAASITVEFQKTDDTLLVFKNCPIVAVSEDIDLALVALPKDGLITSGLSLAVEAVSDGQDVWSAGYPGLGAEPSWQLGHGSVTNASIRIPEVTDPAVTTFIQHSAQIDAGNSGGPLLVEDSHAMGGYRVAGMNSYKASERESTNFAIPSAAIQAFLTSVLDPAAKPKSQAPVLEGRCRDFIGATAQGEDSFLHVARYVSYAFVGKEGEAIFDRVTKAAPKAVRDLILDVFVNYSPIEGIRLAIAYRIQESSRGKSGPLPLGFVAIDGNAESPGADVPVRFLRNGAELGLTWTREQGLWRIAAYPLSTTTKTASIFGGSAGGDGGEDSLKKGPFFLLLASGLDNPAVGLSSTDAFTTNSGLFVDVGLFLGPYFGIVATYTEGSWYDAASYSTYALTRMGGGLRIQLPFELAGLSLVPYASAQVGYLVDESPSGADLSPFYAAFEAGLQGGLAKLPFAYVGVSCRFTRADSSALFPLSVRTWLALAL
jgi:serine protease Do